MVVLGGGLGLGPGYDGLCMGTGNRQVGRPGVPPGGGSCGRFPKQTLRLELHLVRRLLEWLRRQDLSEGLQGRRGRVLESSVTEAGRSRGDVLTTTFVQAAAAGRIQKPAFVLSS